MKQSSQWCPNILNKQDNNFHQLHGTLDALFHKLHSDGIGVQVKHTEIITKADEEKLWTSGVIGVNSPSSLQNAAFCVVGRMLSLRGGVEHRNLKVSQVKRYCDPYRYIYMENIWTTSDGLFKKLRVKGKKSLLNKYLSRLPRKTIECDLFYVSPLTKSLPISVHPGLLQYL